MGASFLKNERLLSSYYRIFLWVSIAILLCIAIGWGAYGVIRWYTIAQQKQRLTQLVQQEQIQLEEFFTQRMQEIEQLADDPALHQLLEPLEQGSPINSDEFATWASAWRQTGRQEKNYVQLLLVDPKGILIGAEKQREDLGTSVIEGMYGNTMLSQVVNQVIATKKAVISDIAYYPNQLRPSMFVAAPCIKDNILQAIIVAELTDTALFTTVQRIYTGGQNKDVVVILGKKSDNRVIWITPLPDDPNIGLLHAVPIDDPRAYAFNQAFEGKSNTGIIWNYYNEKAIASWAPFKMFNWAIVVRQPVHFGDFFAWFYPTLVIVSLVLVAVLFVLLFLLLIWWWIVTHKSIADFLQGAVTRTMIIFLLILSFGGVLFFAHRYVSLIWWRSFALQNEIKMKGQYAIQQLTHHLFKVEDMANTIAYEVGNMPADSNNKERITTLVEHQLRANPSVSGVYVAYKPDAMPHKKHFAPYVWRKDDQFNKGLIPYDYTKKDGKDLPDTSWYYLPLSDNQTHWIDPFFDKVSNTLVIAVSTPFYAAQDVQRTRPIGVVAVTYPLHDIKDLILSLGISGAGYSMIIGHNGAFIYHPKGSFVLDRKTIFDIAKEDKHPILEAIGNQAIAGERGLDVLKSKWWQTSNLLAYYQHIPITGWALIMVFVADESLQAVKKIHHTFVLLAAFSVLMFILLLLLVALSITMTPRRFIGSIGVYSVILFLGMLAVLAESRRALVVAGHGETIITDSMSLRLFLDKIEETMIQRHEKLPLQLKTGLLINLMDFATFGSVRFSGYLWQDVPEQTDQEIEMGVNFPQAQEIKKNDKTYEYRYGNRVVVGWEINGQLVQRQRYAKYPFDEFRVEIVMEPADETRNILLVPDLQAYRLVNPSSRPAFNDEFLYAGFSVEKSFFSYRTYSPDTNLGMPNYLQSSQKVHLVYNIVSLRSWTHSFIVFFLPLTVIMFLLFALLFIIESSPDALRTPVRIITAAASLFFSTLVGHQLLRQQFQLSAVTYVEYFFFLAYVTIALLVVYTNILIRSKIEKSHVFFTFWFWPIQTTAWFIITAIIFY